MRVKRTDLELALSYITKEAPESVDIQEDDTISKGAGLVLSFEDSSKRLCKIIVYAASLHATPDIVVKNKLYVTSK
jgi:hypothetical protein